MVENAEHGVAAITSLAESMRLGREHDVILMDMQMPVMDGFEATARIRKMSFQRPIIALTAHALSHERARCLNVGCDGFVTKPFELCDLVAEICRITSPERFEEVLVNTQDPTDPIEEADTARSVRLVAGV